MNYVIIVVESNLFYTEVDNMNEIKRKLNVSEYAFEIDGRNIVNCYLSYSVNEYDNIVRYADGHKETNRNPIISIEVNGIDLNNEPLKKDTTTFLI